MSFDWGTAAIGCAAAPLLYFTGKAVLTYGRVRVDDKRHDEPLKVLSLHNDLQSLPGHTHCLILRRSRQGLGDHRKCCTCRLRDDRNAPHLVWTPSTHAVLTMHVLSCGEEMVTRVVEMVTCAAGERTVIHWFLAVRFTFYLAACCRCNVSCVRMGAHRWSLPVPPRGWAWRWPSRSWRWGTASSSAAATRGAASAPRRTSPPAFPPPPCAASPRMSACRSRCDLTEFIVSIPCSDSDTLAPACTCTLH